MSKDKVYSPSDVVVTFGGKELVGFNCGGHNDANTPKSEPIYWQLPEAEVCGIAYTQAECDVLSKSGVDTHIPKELFDRRVAEGYEVDVS